MLGRKERDQLESFITGSLKQLIPDEHVLARVDRVLDLSWLREESRTIIASTTGGLRSRGGGSPDARRFARRHRARPQADARGLSQHRDPLVHRPRAS